jgi:hypothetical protein
MLTGGPVQHIGCRTDDPPGWESISGVLKGSTNTGSEEWPVDRKIVGHKIEINRRAFGVILYEALANVQPT